MKSLSDVILIEQFAATAQEEAEKINDQTGAGLVTDQEFWERMGVRTGEDLAKSVLSQTYSDYYKELHNIRPRWVDTTKMSVDDIQALIDELDEYAKSMEAQDAEWWEQHDAQNEPGWNDEMIAAVQNNADSIPDEWIEYDRLPQQQGMGRRPAGSKSQRRMEVKVTEHQLKQIIKEEVQRALNEYRPNTAYGNNAPPRSSNWSQFAAELDIGVLDLDNIAYDLGFQDFRDMDISISPKALAERDPTSFVTAVQDSSLVAEDMDPNEILELVGAQGRVY